MRTATEDVVADITARRANAADMDMAKTATDTTITSTAKADAAETVTATDMVTATARKADAAAVETATATDMVTSTARAVATNSYLRMNSFGKILRLTTFGESHGPGIGGVLDGFPAGIDIDVDFVEAELARRRPGQSALTTARRESDHVEFLSGLWEGKSTGCPIAFLVRNENQHSGDYENLRDVFRPSHADFTYQTKFGLRDHRGGGRTSARETVARVVAGALAKIALDERGISVTAYTEQVGDVRLERDYRRYDFSLIETNAVRCPDPAAAEEMAALITRVKAEGDTVGGVVTCVIQGCPAGLGEPVYDKLSADLGAAMLSINAVKGFEIGEGFAGVARRGSQQNDLFVPAPADGFPVLEKGGALRPSGITTLTNHSGGIQGGISNGNDIVMRIAFKPVATLLQEQPTVNVQGEAVRVQARGRHDPCVLPRAVPVVEAMAALTILDHYLLAVSRKW